MIIQFPGNPLPSYHRPEKAAVLILPIVRVERQEYVPPPQFKARRIEIATPAGDE